MLTKPKRMQIWTPHIYQHNAINFVLDGLNREGAAALFLNPGMGKTSITLEVFRKLKEQGKAKKLLIIAPLRVAQLTWPGEIKKWLNFLDLSYVVLHGSDKEAKLKKNVDVYIINFEGIPWLASQSWSGADMLVIDELTRLKSWTSVRVKALKPFLPTFKYRLGLTGTPVPNGLQDLFSQIYMLDLGKRFGRGITKFKDKYFMPANRFNLYAKPVPYPHAFEEIFEKLKNFAFRIEGKDWIDVPEEVANVIELELPKKLETQYEILRKEFIIELESLDVITAQSAGVLSTKLRQYLSGSIYIDGEVVHIHDYKMEALAEFISDNEGTPILIGYQYRHEVIKFKHKFKQAEFIESKTSEKDLKSIVDRWNAGEIPLLFGHPQSIGHGLNLQEACNNIVFYSLDFNLENHLQFIKRIARQGQKQSHVFIHYLTFKDTIDDHLIRMLLEKKSLQDMLLDYITIKK